MLKSIYCCLLPGVQSVARKKGRIINYVHRLNKKVAAAASLWAPLIVYLTSAAADGSGRLNVDVDLCLIECFRGVEEAALVLADQSKGCLCDPAGDRRRMLPSAPSNYVTAHCSDS